MPLLTYPAKLMGLANYHPRMVLLVLIAIGMALLVMNGAEPGFGG